MSLFATRSLGSGDLRLLFLHGFTQTHRSWQSFADQWTTKYRMELADLPGHGETTVRPSSLDDAGRLTAAVGIDSVLIGYSMGSRIALHAALQPNQRLKGVVLIGAHPGIVDETERKSRREVDKALAQRVEKIGVKAFLEEWLKQPMFDGVRHLDHRDRLRNSADGLAYALRTLGTGNQRALDTELREMTLPVLVLTGERDQKFLDLTTRFRSCLKNATFATIANAGHACHLEQPDATRESIEGWLDELRNSDSHR